MPGCDIRTVKYVQREAYCSGCVSLFSCIHGAEVSCDRMTNLTALRIHALYNQTNLTFAGAFENNPFLPRLLFASPGKRSWRRAAHLL